MVDLIFTAHALERMRARQIPETAVYYVVEDADEVLDRDDECAEYTGVWETRRFMVVACGDREPYRVRTVIETRGRGR